MKRVNKPTRIPLQVIKMNTVEKAQEWMTTTDNENLKDSVEGLIDLHAFHEEELRKMEKAIKLALRDEPVTFCDH